MHTHDEFSFIVTQTGANSKFCEKHALAVDCGGAAGIGHCPCVWRDEATLIVNGKYNMSQYQLDLKAMRSPYCDASVRCGDAPNP